MFEYYIYVCKHVCIDIVMYVCMYVVGCMHLDVLLYMLYKIMDRHHHEEQAIEDRVREKRIVRNSWSNKFIFVRYF
ncbi:hypothetical protein Hanom_Chr10g00891251 [Helianthus anomalus]